MEKIAPCGDLFPAAGGGAKIAFAVPIRLASIASFALCALGCLPLVARADSAPSPCDDASYARDFDQAHYMNEVNRLFTSERALQEAYAARAQAIGDQVVAVGAATREAQAATYQSLADSPRMVELQNQVQQAAEAFRIRNAALQVMPQVTRFDPMRPHRAWCILGTQALQSLGDKVSAESAGWRTLEDGLRAAAASKGVQFAN